LPGIYLDGEQEKEVMTNKLGTFGDNWTSSYYRRKSDIVHDGILETLEKTEGAIKKSRRNSKHKIRTCRCPTLN